MSSPSGICKTAEQSTVHTTEIYSLFLQYVSMGVAHFQVKNCIETRTVTVHRQLIICPSCVVKEALDLEER